MDCDFKNDFENFTKSLREPNSTCVEKVRVVNDTLPPHLRFNENTLSVVLVYSALFVIAAVGNLTVFVSLFKSRHRKSRISLMIRHLAVADLFVTFVMIPIEIGWRLTVQWLAGNLACKTFLFLRAFGLYLSSNVLVCVSLDRYFAILHPLRSNDARRRGKYMLACAWGVSLAYSVPQSFIFHVAAHPEYPTFFQCVSFGFFATEGFEVAYNVFCLAVMYFIPLLVILVAYTAIMWEISSKSKETKIENQHKPNGKLTLRRSDVRNIARARSRTLKMTITIVVVFVWCWTPYVVMTLWYMIDRTSAEKLPNWLQDALFMMAVSNSCMNPMVYGSYAMNFRKECSKCFCCIRDNQESGLTRKSTDADKKLAAAGQPGLARRFIKCVLGLKKVESGTTKSTCSPMLHQVVRNPTPRPNFARNEPVSPKEKHSPTMARPVSIGYISMLASRSHNSGYVTNCHSDPFPCTEDINHLSTSSFRCLNSRDRLTFESTV